MATVNRVFITGDRHGDFDWLPDWCRENQTTTDDILILLGDHALRFEGANRPREVNRKKLVAAQPITIFALRGNHDRPYYKEDGTVWEDIELTECPLLDNRDYGGLLLFEDKMWHDKTFYNIWYFQDGKEYFIKNKNFFTYGGAYSVDKEWRQLMHWTWYPNEIVSSGEHAAALDTIDHHHFNYVLTHTCPTDWQPVDLFMRGLDQSKVDTRMEEYLDDVLRYIGGYEHWYFGHYHANRDYGKLSEYEWNGETVMLFDEVRRIL